jgi:hypothetical protein
MRGGYVAAAGDDRRRRLRQQGRFDVRARIERLDHLRVAIVAASVIGEPNWWRL